MSIVTKVCHRKQDWSFILIHDIWINASLVSIMTKHSLLTHIVYEDKTYLCEHCDKLFTMKDNLITHRDSVNLDKTYFFWKSEKISTWSYNIIITTSIFLISRWFFRNGWPLALDHYQPLALSLPKSSFSFIQVHKSKDVDWRMKIFTPKILWNFFQNYNWPYLLK